MCTLIGIGIKITNNFASSNDLIETKQEFRLNDKAIQQQVETTNIRLEFEIATDKKDYYQREL